MIICNLLLYQQLRQIQQSIAIYINKDQYPRPMRTVYGKGLNIVGQIDKTMKNYRTFTPIQQLQKYKVKAIGCGYLQTYYLLEDEQLIKAGHYMDGLTSTRILNFYRLLPRVYKSFQYCHPINRKFFFDLGRKGKILSDEPQFQLLNRQQVVANTHFRHSVFGHSGIHLFDDENNMYTIGQNYFGQRGTGDQKTNEAELRKIQYMEVQTQAYDEDQKQKKTLQQKKQQDKAQSYKLMKQKIVDVALGFQHTLLIIQNGELYGCGKAEAGQIQPAKYHYYKDVVYIDKIISPDIIWNKRKVIRAACGYKHSIFQTQDGKIYGLGLNKFGQCGIDYTKFGQLRKPTQIFFPAMEGQKIQDIQCGSNHTLILTNYNLYFMGIVKSNQNPFMLYNQNVSAPSIMNLPSRPIKIFTNFDRTGIITEDGKAYIFGGKNLEHRQGQSGKLQVIEDFKFNSDSLIGLGFSHTIICP